MADAPTTEDRVDDVSITFNDKQFRVQFKKTLAVVPSEPDAITSKEVFTAYTAPHYVRDLMNGLKKSLEEYEKTYGPVLSPADMQKKLKAQQEEAQKKAQQTKKIIQWLLGLVFVLAIFAWWAYSTSQPKSTPPPPNNAPQVNKTLRLR